MTPIAEPCRCGASVTPEREQCSCSECVHELLTRFRAALDEIGRSKTLNRRKMQLLALRALGRVA